MAFQEYVMCLFICICVCFVLIISKVMDLEDSDVEIAVAGLAWTLCVQRTETERQRRARLDVLGPVVRRRRRRPRRWLVRPWLETDIRLQFGHYNRLIEELRMEDAESFRNFLRMDLVMFDELLNSVGPRITKKNTWYRQATEPGLKLALTLRYLCTRDSYSSLANNLRVRHNTISLFVPEVCGAVVEVCL